MDKKGMQIHDLRKVMEGKSMKDATQTIMPTVIPTIYDMNRRIEQEKRNRLKDEEKAFLAKSNEDQDKEIRENLPFSEMLAGLRNSLRSIYPDCSVMMIGQIPISSESSNVVFEYAAKDDNMLATSLNECMLHSKVALTIVNNAIKLFCRTASASEAEQGITAMQDIIMSLRNRNDPATRIKLLMSEIKRLKKAGRLDLMKIKEQELDRLYRQIDIRKKRIVWLEKAREAKKEKKRKREEEKKKSASEDNGVKSCSMFQNVG